MQKKALSQLFVLSVLYVSINHAHALTSPSEFENRSSSQNKLTNQMNYNAVVLTYHGISDISNNMNTSLKTFEQQMQYLYENHYTVIKGSELIQAIRDKSSLPEKSVVLTFDDGWKNQNLAMAVLNKYKYPATFGLVSIFQKQNSSTGLQKEDFNKYKTDSFDYVNHSYTHRKTDYLGNPVKDLDNSEAVLKQLFGKLSPYYIYPYGLKNANLVAQLKKRGYLGAYGVTGVPVDTRHANIYNVPRYLINDKVTLDNFKKILND